MNATYKKPIFDLTNEFSVKRLTADDEDKATLFQMFSLRYQEYNKWIRPPFDKILMDKDPFDDLVHCHYGVFHKERLIAYQRVILKPNPFMLEYAYDGCFENIVLAENSAEVSRAVIHPEYQGFFVSNKFRGHTMLSLLNRECYRTCKENQTDYTYLASTSHIIRMARLLGYPFEALQTATLENGDTIEAVRFSWEEFIHNNSKSRPEFAQWFQE